MKFGLQTLKDHSSCSVEVCYISEARRSATRKKFDPTLTLLLFSRAKRQTFPSTAFAKFCSSCALVSRFTGTPTLRKTRLVCPSFACAFSSHAASFSFGYKTLAMKFCFVLQRLDWTRKLRFSSSMSCPTRESLKSQFCGRIRSFLCIGDNTRGRFRTPQR